MMVSDRRSRGSKVEKLPDGPINWNRRFIRTLKVNGKQTYIISDYKFWSNNQVELENWLIANTEDGLDTQEGMTINV